LTFYLFYGKNSYFIVDGNIHAANPDEPQLENGQHRRFGRFPELPTLRVTPQNDDQDFPIPSAKIIIPYQKSSSGPKRREIS